MALTMQDLMTDLKAALNVFEDWSTAHATGDGVTTRFKLPDYPIVDDHTLTAVQISPEGTQTDVQMSEYAMDPLTGWFAFYTAPATDYKVQWAWKFVPFTDEELLRLINAGVRYIVKDIRVPNSEVEMDTDLYTYEYAMPAGCKTIKTVELRVTEYDLWQTTPYWKTRDIAGTPRLQFTRPPGLQHMRVTYEGGPVRFEGSKDVDGLYDEAITACGLPEDCYDPLLHYAVWMALNTAVTHRTRDDAAQHANEEVSVTMRDLETRANNARTLFELHLSRFASELEHGRIIG